MTVQLSSKFVVSHAGKLSLLAWASFVSVVFALWMAFIYCPDEVVMGPVQRVFYFHVAAAINTYIFVFFLLCGGALYLVTGDERWDYLAEPAAWVGLFLAAIVLATGMIWGHSAWNTWWSWEPRLVSFLVLWMLLGVYFLVRRAGGDSARVYSTSAIVGILAAINIPIVIFSIRVLAAAEQLHPQVIARSGLSDPRYSQGLLAAWFGIFLFSLLLMGVRAADRINKRELALRIKN
jgi:heme exporter protein C